MSRVPIGTSTGYGPRAGEVRMRGLGDRHLTFRANGEHGTCYPLLQDQENEIERFLGMGM